MTAVEILRDARALIADEAHWCRGPVATNAHGREVSAVARTAVCWCAYGALIRVGNGQTLGDRSAAEEALIAAAHRQYPDLSYIDVNEDFGHAAILAVFDQALADLDTQHAAAVAL